MGSRPCINMSLLLIIASSMAMLASSDPIHPETAYDLPTCLEALKGCLYEIHQFKMGLLNGVVPQPGCGLIGQACCAAILDIHQKCWLFMLPDPFFTPQLQNYCTRQSQMAPPPGYPLAPAPPTDPEAPSPAPEVDPPAAPAPEVDPPAPAPHAQAPAPEVDPPAPAPRKPSPDPPAPSPHRRCRPRHHHGPGGSQSEKWFCT